jgi:tetratricopeptide (TPR) repeat protein
MTMESMMLTHGRTASDRARPAAIAAVLAGATAGTAALGQAGPPLVPEDVPLHPAARTAIDARWLTPQERRRMRVFHGVWDDRDLQDAPARAQVALNAWEFDHGSLADPSVDPEVRAEALLLRGDLEDAAALLEGTASNRAARIRAEAHEGLGRHRDAERSVEPVVQRLLDVRTDDPGELTEGVGALVVRARLQGQPARDYEAMMSLLARAHQELDRLYWPAKLAEARLLVAKDNQPEAIDALHETLALNPRCAEAWFMLGRIALERFDFDSAQLAADRLRLVAPAHPLADLLEAEALLIRDDPDGAAELLGAVTARLPRLRPALALLAAAEALRYDREALRGALDRFEALSPGSPAAYHVVGRFLSLGRQYEAAADMLDEAIRRQPAWPAPQIELGLMALQSGRDEEGLAVLEDVCELDPFNKRAGNSLFLLRELAGYETVESEHFIIRYKPGVDEVMVRMMVEPLERIHADVSARFRHEPSRKTTIELMPDHARFAVRITGMPWIHTIAACTGPVIALEVPRDGPPAKHRGPFDWQRVVRHEYTHTITLSQTRNRIPHWLTEAAAVNMEEAPRDYETCRLLAAALHEGSLLDLEEIKWAFVRPRRPEDRALAYAQGHWMVQYMDERFGSSALVRLIGLYFDGVREELAMSQALSITRDEFFRDFLVWARRQVEAWGLAPQPALEELEDRVRWADPDLAAVMRESRQARLDVIADILARRIGRPADSPSRRRRFEADQWPALIRPPVEIDRETLDGWLAAHPDHPDLIRLALERRLEADGALDDEAMELLDRYGRLRPVDPYPDRILAYWWLESDTPERAIPNLERLDALEQKSPSFAEELARLYRGTGDLDAALRKATRAVQINPYHAARRELAASIAIEAGRLDLARQHVEALILIEPDRPQHRRRLEALRSMIDG